MAHAGQNSGDLTKSDQCFQQALSLSAKLTNDRRQHLDVFDMQFQHAIMSPFAHQPATAKDTLISFVDRGPVNHTQASRITRAQHLLGQIWLQFGKLGETRILCRQALDTRLRLHVNQSRSTCLTLCSHELKNSTRTAFYLKRHY